MIKDPWNTRLLPHYWLALFFVLSHLLSGARVIMIAHRVHLALGVPADIRFDLGPRTGNADNKANAQVSPPDTHIKCALLTSLKAVRALPSEASCSPNHSPEKSMITLEDARKVIAAAEKKAKELRQPMNIAVADGGGNLVAHVRMDDAWLGSIDIAIKKAFTSRAFNISTRDLAQHSQSGGEFFGIHASNGGRVMIFAGGVPLQREGKIVGAIGVSGGSGEQDHAVAEAGARAFG
jgi:uncharacterized protein GlcG (DUF336 family)